MKIRALVVLSLLLLSCLVSPSQGLADASSELVEAESRASNAASVAAAADRTAGEAKDAYAPIAARAEAAGDEVAAAEARIESIRDEVVAERQAAAREIAAAESNYDDERSSQNLTTAIGLVVAVVALPVAAAAFVFSRFRSWPLSKPLTQSVGAGLGAVFVGGLLLALVPSSPRAPEFSEETTDLARAAAGDPADPPTPELKRAEAALVPVQEAAEPLNAAAEKAKNRWASAASKGRAAQRVLVSAEKDVRVAAKEVERIEDIAHEEEDFKAEASSIDYDQLAKNPEAYRGEKVVYTGQIFQIQEEEGFGFMLLSVTDEGYGFWTDNIWVNFTEPIAAAEEDVVTVYGKMTGSEEYETQIGGSTYVPRMNAKYIDE